MGGVGGSGVVVVVSVTHLSQDVHPVKHLKALLTAHEKSPRMRGLDSPLSAGRWSVVSMGRVFEKAKAAKKSRCPNCDILPLPKLPLLSIS